MYSGAAILFERDPSGTWSEANRFDPSNSDSMAAGESVFIQGNLMGWSNIATAKVQFRSLGIEEVARICTSTPNSTGSAARLEASGCDSLIANSLTLEAAPVPANAAGLFLYGPRPAQYPIENGFMCIGAGRRRLGVTHADAAGSLRATLDFQSPQAEPIQARSTWYFQTYFRDQGTGAGFDF